MHPMKRAVLHTSQFKKTRFFFRVSKWQRINHMVPGMYAISVNGRLPPSIVRELKTQGLHYKSRDTSQRMRE